MSTPLALGEETAKVENPSKQSICANELHKARRVW